ncbi:MAG TPA: threonine synthase [Candidatus Rifleibacterium sp.]|nr:threonine synthase [Candidatus Rifleibacterium sp.]HPT47558.1 threonine synthase [Candidatus Rifleibacterium sp.]
MLLYNLLHPEDKASFSQALQQGLGRDRGLFFPEKIPVLEDVETLLRLPFVERSEKILAAWLADEIPAKRLGLMVRKAFSFPVPVVRVDARRFALELFHGPTLAFKDFGARFMAQCLSELAGNQPVTILTATSGDTGAAVAAAFHNLPNIRVVILYPEGRISTLQEKMFCTLGGNIHTIAISSDFDACQELVKQAFADTQLNRTLHLNSANSINISRLLAQICYFFEGIAVARAATPGDPVVAVPSGNFGDLTAGLFAQAMGLPIKRFIAATNANDTVPRYLKTSVWAAKPTVQTMSNAMDVAEPSNWPRVEAIFRSTRQPLSQLTGIAISEDETRASMIALHASGYLAEPHAAVAACALEQSLGSGETGLFLATAHPAKFKDRVDETLKTTIPLPMALAEAARRPSLSEQLPPDFGQLKERLQQICQVR